jgi:hypothetical protein
LGLPDQEKAPYLGATALDALEMKVDPVGEKVLARDLMAIGASATGRLNHMMQDEAGLGGMQR